MYMQEKLLPRKLFLWIHICHENLQPPFVDFGSGIKKMCDCFFFNIFGHKHARRLRHLNGGIHSSVWNTETLLYNIWEPKYKQIKIEIFDNPAS